MSEKHRECPACGAEARSEFNDSASSWDCGSWEKYESSGRVESYRSTECWARQIEGCEYQISSWVVITHRDERIEQLESELAVAVDLIDEAMRLWGDDEVGCACDDCRVTRKGRALIDKWDTRLLAGVEELKRKVAAAKEADNDD